MSLPPLPCIIRWDPEVFAPEKRSLPSALTLHTQLHQPDAAWSVVFSMKTPPVEQGLETFVDEVRFLVDDAPHYLLSAGSRFPYFDGGNIIGECEVLPATDLA